MADGRTEVALACRGLGLKGLGAGIGGHVSVRDGDAYWVNRVDRAFVEIGPDDVLRVDIETGDVVDGSSRPSPGVGFHNAIYQARDDVGSVVHTHADWITALAALRRAPRMLNVRSTYFVDDLVVSPDDDLEAVAPALGASSAMLVPYHGAITVGPDLGSATALHVTLEEAARIDVLLAAAAVEPMSEAEALAMKKVMVSADYLALTWDLIRRLAVAADG